MANATNSSVKLVLISALVFVIGASFLSALMSVVPQAQAMPQEQVRVTTNGRNFSQGDPIAVLTTATMSGPGVVSLGNLKSEYATVEGPCGEPYINFAFLIGEYPNIASYEDLLALKDSVLNVRYPHAPGQVSCPIFSKGAIAVEITPPQTMAIPMDVQNEIGAKTLNALFPSGVPITVTRSNATVTYIIPDGNATTTQKWNQPLSDFERGITKYYDIQLTREKAGNSTLIYRASHDLEPGKYTIVGFTMSGSVSEPIIISISPRALTSTTSGSSFGSTVYAMFFTGSSPASALIMTLGSVVAASVLLKRSGNAWKGKGSSSAAKIAAVVGLALLMAITSLPTSMPAYAAWDKGAQGIQVSGTSSGLNILNGRTDVIGWRTIGTSDGTGTSSQVNGYVSGFTTGTSYLWAQSLVSWRADSSTYNTYTCNTWPSGTDTCAYVDAIVMTHRAEFHSGQNVLSGCSDGTAGFGFWTNSGFDCYHTDPSPLVESPFTIGQFGYKRFSLYDSMTLDTSTGKITFKEDFQRCSSQSTCNSQVNLGTWTSPQVASSSQKFTSGTVGGTTYYPNSVFVGHSGGADYFAKTNTYIEQYFDVTDSTSGTASYSKCATGNICNSPGEGNDDMCWNTSIGDTGVTRYFKSSAKFNTSCDSSGP